MKFTALRDSAHLFVWAALALAPTVFTLHAAATPETELKDATGNIVAHYVVDAPAGLAAPGTRDPARQVGLIFCFQEHGTPTGNDIFPVREALRRLGIRDGFVLLAAHSQNPNGKMGPADLEAIQRLLAWAEKTYPVNPRRVFLYGKGEGGKVSGEFAGFHPDLVTAAISYSWGWWSMPAELTEPLNLDKSAELYMVLGRRDLSFHLTTVRDTYERAKAKGYHIIYREFDELADRTYHPPSNDDAIAWATRLRNKNIPPSPEEANLLKAFNKGTPPAPVNGYYPTLALVGGVPAGAVLRKLFDAPDATIRAAAAETCRYGIFDEPTTAALGKLLTDSSDRVRLSAADAMAMYANWRSEAAQKVLVQLALDPGADPEARVTAADAIAQAVRYQVKGYVQDPALFRTLVALLNEKYEPLHAVAYLTLAPIRDPDYKSAPNAKQRKEPAEGWDAWLDAITAKADGDWADYKVCGRGQTGTAGAWPGNRGSQEPVDLFCMGAASLSGTNWATGQAVRQDPAQGFKYMLQAAQAGYLPAAEAAGMLYMVGKGVEESPAEAAKWWIQAVEAGNPRAIANFGALVRSGQGGVRRDPVLFARWTKYAADHNLDPNP